MKYLIGIVVAAVVIIGGLYVYSNSSRQTAPEPAPQAGEGGAADANNDAASGTPTNTTGATPTSAAQAGATVTYTASGFSPKTVTVKKGESVTFIDQTGKGMWVASAQHPTHTAYSGTTRTAHCPDTAGTAFDQCGIGSSYTFTFQKTGAWAYHNHVDAGDIGKVIVE